MPRLSALGSPREITAVLFDAGGTLIRLDHGFIAERAAARGVTLRLEALAEGEARARHEIDARAERERGVQDRDADRIAGYFGALLGYAGVGDADCAPLAAELAEEQRRANLWRVPLPGAAETLAGLRERGFRTGVVSNADGRVASLLGAAGLTDHLECILDSHLEGVEKPDPEIFARALTRLEVAADATVYVGDIYAIDVRGARAAGLEAILIDETGTYPERDCARIRRLADLLD
ncbi:MAG: HAD family hydrolase [Myxococcota bacterium]